MRLHTNRILFKIPITLFTSSKLASDFFMFFYLAQRDDLETIGVILAPDLCQLEDFSKLGSIHHRHELTMLFGLFAIAALATALLPLRDARLAVDCTLAHDAEDGNFSLWHDDFLANDAKSVGKQTKSIQLFTVANAVFRHEVRRSK